MPARFWVIETVVWATIEPFQHRFGINFTSKVPSFGSSLFFRWVEDFRFLGCLVHFFKSEMIKRIRGPRKALQLWFTGFLRCGLGSFIHCGDAKRFCLSVQRNTDIWLEFAAQFLLNLALSVGLQSLLHYNLNPLYFAVYLSSSLSYCIFYILILRPLNALILLNQTTKIHQLHHQFF